MSNFICKHLFVIFIVDMWNDPTNNSKSISSDLVTPDPLDKPPLYTPKYEHISDDELPKSQVHPPSPQEIKKETESLFFDLLMEMGDLDFLSDSGLPRPPAELPDFSKVNIDYGHGREGELEPDTPWESPLYPVLLPHVGDQGPDLVLSREGYQIFVVSSTSPSQAAPTGGVPVIRPQQQRGRPPAKRAKQDPSLLLRKKASRRKLRKSILIPPRARAQRVKQVKLFLKSTPNFTPMLPSDVRRLGIFWSKGGRGQPQIPTTRMVIATNNSLQQYQEELLALQRIMPEETFLCYLGLRNQLISKATKAHETILAGLKKECDKEHQMRFEKPKEADSDFGYLNYLQQRSITRLTPRFHNLACTILPCPLGPLTEGGNAGCKTELSSPVDSTHGQVM